MEKLSICYNCVQFHEKNMSFVLKNFRDALQDVMTKVLQKVANQPEGKDEIIDDTIVAI